MKFCLVVAVTGWFSVRSPGELLNCPTMLSIVICAAETGCSYGIYSKTHNREVKRLHAPLVARAKPWAPRGALYFMSRSEKIEVTVFHMLTELTIATNNEGSK